MKIKIIGMHVIRIIVLLFTFWLLFVKLPDYSTGGMAKGKMKEANDAVSRAVYDKVGKKVSYEERLIKDRITSYTYLILDTGDEALIADITGAFNDVLEANDTKKVDLRLYEKMSFGHGKSLIAVYSNYDSHELSDGVWYAYGKCFNCLQILGGFDDDSPYNFASSYPSLEGIEYLKVIEKVNRNAEEEGIDWYEMFPDLQGYTVYKQDYTGETIVYQEMKE